MSENVQVLPRREQKEHALRSESQLENVHKIGDVTIAEVTGAGSQGWLLRGTSSEGADTMVKLALDSDSDTTSRYEKNAKLLEDAYSRTAFVPAYHDYGVTTIPGQEGKFSYIAMEYIQGQTLEDLLREGTLDTKDALALIRTIAYGVDALLGKDGDEPIISTDLKPSNIQMRASTGQPVLIDLDAGVREGDSIRVDGEKGFRGSWPYSGPDQSIDGNSITRKLNTWQVAAMAFEMLTNEKFMNVESPMGVILKYAHEDKFNDFLKQRLDEVDLPPQTKDVFAKALAFNPDDRQNLALEFINDLDTSYGLRNESTHRKDENIITKAYNRVLQRFRRSRTAQASPMELEDLLQSEEPTVEFPSIEQRVSAESDTDVMDLFNDAEEEMLPSTRTLRAHVLPRRPITQTFRRRHGVHEQRDTTRPGTNGERHRHRALSSGKHRVSR